MFSEKLKELRTKAGLSQEELASKIFVSRSAVAKWEQGRGLPEDDSVERLAALFNVPSDSLITKEDMKQEIEISQEDAKNNKKKATISSIIAGVTVVALAVTFICGALVYSQTDEEATQTATVDNIDTKDSRIISLGLSKGGTINYSKWNNSVFVNEAKNKVEAVTDLKLREGDKVEVSYLVDRNMFGQQRIGSRGVSEIALLSHPFTLSQSLYGFGVSFQNMFSGEDLSFSASADNVAYIRFFELNPESNFATIDSERKNVTSFKWNYSYNTFTYTINVSILFDLSKVTGNTYWPFFNNISNIWDRTYYDMADGQEKSDIGTSYFLDIETSFTGAIYNHTHECTYDYVTYNVKIASKANPSKYLIKSYDSSDALVGTLEVLPTTDLNNLVLPATRAYSMVEEYLNGAQQASTKVAKGETGYIFFSNSYGFFDMSQAKVTL
jgi:transcriptional regulator with XRE-family HTH domain